MKTLCHVFGQLEQVGNRLPEVLDFFEQYDIPVDMSFSFTKSKEVLQDAVKWQEKGNIVGPWIFPPNIDPKCTNHNWWTYDYNQCMELLKKLQVMMNNAGFATFDALSTYTPGNEFIQACKDFGIRYLMGFCAPVFIQDGNWKILHTGSPLSPFMPGSEDYRKPQIPVDDKVLLCANMELRNPLTCFESWNEGPFCPLNMVMGDRTIEPTDFPLETMAGIEDFIRQSELSGQETMFHLNLQYFTSGKCFDLNRAILLWLKDQEAKQRLTFISLADYAGKVLEKGCMLPQKTYWRGECMGMHVGSQPGNGNECIVDESAAGQWVFRKNSATPERHFKWQGEKWDFPAFDPRGEKPANNPYKGNVQIQNVEINADYAIISFSAECAESGTSKLAIWNALENLKAPFFIHESAVDTEIVPHPGGTGGCILISGNFANSATYIIKIGHSGQMQNNHSKIINDLISLETTWKNNIPITRLASLVPYELKFSVTFKEKLTTAPVQMDFVNGKNYGSGIQCDGTVAITLNGKFCASMARFYGVTADNIIFNEREINQIKSNINEQAKLICQEFAPEFADSAKYLDFSPGESPQWIRQVAKNSATQEIEKVNKIVSQMFPGEIAYEHHAASDLEFGTKGRVRSQHKDRSINHSGVAGEMITGSYDYGQSYGPGITGWNMFSKMDIGFKNLKKNGSYSLILNTFDPEYRNARMMITGNKTNLEAETAESAKVILKEYFLTAQGIENRHAKKAFIKIDIPREMTQFEAVMIILHSFSQHCVYDRLTEGHGFLFLSHLWLIKND